MADNSLHASTAVVLLLSPAGGQPAALLMHLDGQAAPLALPPAATGDMLQLASRLLQAAGDWLVPGSALQQRSHAITAAAAPSEGIGRPPRPLKAGPFQVDGPHRLVRWRGPEGWRSIDLTDIERRLLCQLLGAAGRVCSRSDIASGVWGAEAHNLRTVDQCVRRLRRSMLAAGVPDCIKTVRGVGYRLVPAVAGRRGMAILD